MRDICCLLLGSNTISKNFIYMAYSGKWTCRLILFYEWSFRDFPLDSSPCSFPHMPLEAVHCAHTPTRPQARSLLFPLTPTNRTAGELQTHRKAAWPAGRVPVVGYFSSELGGSRPASWSVSPFWSGRTDSAHHQALEMETGPSVHSSRWACFGDLLPWGTVWPWAGTSAQYWPSRAGKFLFEGLREQREGG